MLIIQLPEVLAHMQYMFSLAVTPSGNLANNPEFFPKISET